MTIFFEANNSSGFLAVGKELRNTKINDGDEVIINVKAKDQHDYLARISSMIAHNYCLFIKNCRTGVNFSSQVYYTYPDKHLTLQDCGKYVGTLLKQNTGINISIKKLPNKYSLDLPDFYSEPLTLKEAYRIVRKFCIENSPIPGDEIILNIQLDNFDFIQKKVWYTCLVEELKAVRHISGITTLFPEEEYNCFGKTETGNKAFIDRLMMVTGIRFIIPN